VDVFFIIVTLVFVVAVVALAAWVLLIAPIVVPRRAQHR
jgi:hypothetical protein